MASSNLSPRQKMINLMYLVFIAMMALNVSSEVLEGFELVEEGLLRTVKSSSQNNERIYGDLETYYANNPEKAGAWYESATQVRDRSNELFDYIQDLKVRIVKRGDGKDGDPEHLKHPDDLNASQEVMFERGKDDAKKLKVDLESYRGFITSMVTNPSIKNIIESNFSTEPSAKAKENGQSWEESMFWNMPMAAAITLLTKMQNDIRYAQGEVLSDLLKNIDVSDLRVNTTEAFVIPESQTVMRGGVYRANIVLAAVDSTLRPTVHVNGQDLPESANGVYTAVASGAGPKTVSGYVEMPRGDGSMLRQEFSTQYMVVEPSATIAPVMMNVLYMGIDNDISIAANGVATQNLTPTMTNGTLTNKGNGIWTARPARAGVEAEITVMGTVAGRSQMMGQGKFRVRPLPDPTPYISIKDANGNSVKFNRGPLQRNVLLNAGGVRSAIDDGILDIEFTVLRFEVVTNDSFGNTIRNISNGQNFSQAQIDQIRKQARGNSLFISNIRARGPGGDERDLKTALEIIIN